MVVAKKRPPNILDERGKGGRKNGERTDLH